ncbi:MAG: hypothetical protein LBD50_02615 [Rickettsiales bacterium]|jgi:hypothetical protein|nr:hypothetical protein [Rickettsiales bacterium]
MPLKTNCHYFDFSIKHPEILDARYMFLNWDKDIDKYIKTTKKLKELLATIKTLKSAKQNADAFYAELHNLIMNKFSSKSELNCFVNACDATTKTIKNDLNSFKHIVDLYLKHRDFTEITPKEWIQAIIDKGASRAKGSVGEDKLLEIAAKSGFIIANDWNKFLQNKKVAAKFSKNNFDIAHIKEHLGIDLKFNSQGKMLDIILKNNDKYVFIEAKHLKEGGGSQDKQIKELIGIIQKPTAGNNIFHGAFLDGIYSNEILNDIEQAPLKAYGKTKVISQQTDIVNALKTNKNSLWLNTAGYTEFIKDFS